MGTPGLAALSVGLGAGAAGLPVAGLSGVTTLPTVAGLSGVGAIPGVAALPGVAGLPTMANLPIVLTNPVTTNAGVPVASLTGVTGVIPTVAPGIPPPGVAIPVCLQTI